MNRITRTKRTLLPLALLLAIAAPGHVLAQSANPQELEARIAQLEPLVQALKTELEAQKAAAPAAPRRARRRHSRSRPPPSCPPPIPARASAIGGFIKLDAMVTDTNDGEIADGSAGRLFYLPSAMPVGGADEADPDLDVHAQFSRFWFAADTDIDGHKVKGYIEADVFGNANGNEHCTQFTRACHRRAFEELRSVLVHETGNVPATGEWCFAKRELC